MACRNVLSNLNETQIMQTTSYAFDKLYCTNCDSRNYVLLNLSILMHLAQIYLKRKSN